MRRGDQKFLTFGIQQLRICDPAKSGTLLDPKERERSGYRRRFDAGAPALRRQEPPRLVTGPTQPGNIHKSRYRLSVMNTLRACSAVGLALVVSLTLPSCTKSKEPAASPTPRESDSDSRVGMDDIVVTEAALEPFIDMDASRAYVKLRRQHFQVLFGPAITRGERNNIRGVQTHPDVVIEDLELGSNEEVIITEVSCTPRVAKRSDNYC